MFFAMEPQTSRVYVSPHAQGLFKPSKRLIRDSQDCPARQECLFWCAKAPQHGQLGLLHGQRVLVVFCIV